ncbi:unnamed protein product [Candidula unifasciata]|uniref:Beta-lactamase-related domain-containing protein n=1 Tax=Candidula unifasciata TaxID=100452 RepID=A0A8S3ZMY1_9EUPU|nr:unnamed protein product [Candidula unifasciata]
MSLIWLGVFIFLLSAEKTICQSPNLELEVNELVYAGMAARGIPTVSLAVVHNGTVVLTKGYGVKDIITKSCVDADTVFGIASLTKAFTNAVLTKMLRNSSVYDLSSTIKTILGQNTTFNSTLLSNFATLKDLMVHAMGIPRNNFMRLDNELTRENLMARLQYLPSTKEFRGSFVYSDLMYGLLTHITEVLHFFKNLLRWHISISTLLWEDIVASEIFQPLDMANSTFMTRVNFSSPNVAAPYYVDKNKQATLIDADFLRVYSSNGGSGAIMSTANDMGKYLQFLVNGGKNQEGKQVVETSELQAAFAPLAALPLSSQQYPIAKPVTPVTMSTDNYGLGWRRGYYRGYKMIQHTGSTHGYNSMITILPHSGSAVYTALSGYDGGYSFRASLHCAILDLLLHETPWINSTTIASFPSPWVRAARRKRNTLNVVNNEEKDGYIAKKLAEEAEDGVWCDNILNMSLISFTGNYFHGAYGKANITLDLAANKLKMFYGIGKWNLSYTGSDLEFNADWLGQPPSYDIQLKFLAKENVYGFECLDCDPKYVPTFYRHQYVSSSSNNNNNNAYIFVVVIFFIGFINL